MSEYALHVSVVELLDRFALPGVLFWHCNNTVSNVRYASKLKRLGVKPGVADLTILTPSRRMPCFIEFKAPKGRLSDEQQAFGLQVKLLGCRYEIARSIEEATDWLVEFGAIEAGRITGVKRRDAA